MGNNQRQTTAKDYILNLVRETRPDTVEHLISLVQQKHPDSEKEILDCIIELQNEGKLVFKNQHTLAVPSLRSYLLSTQAQWYWLMITVAAITAILLFTAPEVSYPLVYAKYTLGSLFILVLPGYSIVKALFPSKEMEGGERAALSIGLSLGLFPVIGFILNYTPWGIRLTPLTLCLLTLTITFSTIALLREYDRLHVQKRSTGGVSAQT